MARTPAIDLDACRALAHEITTDLARVNHQAQRLRTDREKLMRLMHRQGCTYDQIAAMFGVTRQRVWSQVRAR